MTIDKQALREAAEKATRGPWEMERGNIWFTDEDGYTKHLAYVQQGDDVDDKQDHYNTAFIAVANPATMLALRDDMRQAREKLEAAERRIAEHRKVLNSIAAVARRYLPDYDEHPEIQAADELLESAAGIGVKGE
ncbi:ead/Ea22-like family protein [Salmonella enterica]|uniref:ead/Ea22-like family protein n=1 Tax=Salmonella enterica TaxID=28901 RepID=UPI0009AE8604|nr:ead/Ea22-like family protein [Salmonella enterica]EBL6901695.1 ead/Ea22-like family protein [Salmonella enterica]EBM6481353.1 ead/Ea22-like family protein [Salmonella enterica]EBS7296169.1 ead/Ea22-like family protein [Salmonella enterica]EEK5796759.1 ead/Ea22-like family protein [Salmonella enterica]EGC8223572.1 ead/Ea22-like family protein [Salmonella enterica]